MKTGGETKSEFKLWEMSLEYCPIYKNLGCILKDKNMSDHTKALKGNVEAAYQAVLAITGNTSFENLNEIKSFGNKSKPALWQSPHTDAKYGIWSRYQ